MRYDWRGGSRADENETLVHGHRSVVRPGSAMAASGGADDRGNTQFGSSGLGFAIPADSAKRIAGELIATGTASHGWLGRRSTLTQTLTVHGSPGLVMTALPQRAAYPLVRL
jgi:S1-C subfamily serine protease